MTAARWITWSAGALFVVGSLVLAGRARLGLGHTRAAWFAMIGGCLAGVTFSALVLAGS